MVFAPDRAGSNKNQASSKPANASISYRRSRVMQPGIRSAAAFPSFYNQCTKEGRKKSAAVSDAAAIGVSITCTPKTSCRQTHKKLGGSNFCYGYMFVRSYVCIRTYEKGPAIILSFFDNRRIHMK